MRISDWSSDVCSSDLAIDAAVIGLTDRGMLQRVARANEESRNRLIDDMPEPWEGFRDELREKVNGVIVSLRPDHGTGGRLHEETAYGLVRDPAREDGRSEEHTAELQSLMHITYA